MLKQSQHFFHRYLLLEPAAAECFANARRGCRRLANTLSTTCSTFISGLTRSEIKGSRLFGTRELLREFPKKAAYSSKLTAEAPELLGAVAELEWP